MGRSNQPSWAWWVVGIVIPILVAIVGYLAPKPISPPILMHPQKDHEKVPTPEDTTGAGNRDQKSPDVIRVTGIGPPQLQISDPVQRKYLSREAARADALKQLAESIRGVVVKSFVRVGKGKVEEHIVELKVETILKSTRIVSETTRADGNYEIIMETTISRQDFER